MSLKRFAESGLALRATIPKKGENRNFSLYNVTRSRIGSYWQSKSFGQLRLQTMGVYFILG